MTPLVLLFTLAFLVSVDVRILAPVLPSIATSFGATAGATGLAMTTYSLAYGTGQLVYGPLSDRFGRIAVIRTAALGFSACSVLSALSLTTWQFVAARLLAGAFAGAVIPLTIVYIGDTYAYTERQVAIARFAVVTSAGLAFSASIGGMVAHFISWRAMLAGYGLLALVPVWLMFSLGAGRPPRSAGAGERVVRYMDFLTEPRALLVYVLIFTEGFLCWGAVTYLGAFAHRRLGLDQLQIGLLIALFGVGTMVGGSLMAPFRRRLSENALAGTGGFLMSAAFFVLIPRWPWPAFAASMLMLGLGFVGLHSTLQLRGTEISSTARGKAFSLFAFNLFTGIAVGTAVLGRLVDAGLDDTMLAVSGVGLALVGAAAASVRHRRAK
ncbi:MAG: MFS transporter [Candidatus Rokubacteria bacterium]|nr:MFS transporter [Candidatus Rokubacteria bacterium]